VYAPQTYGSKILIILVKTNEKAGCRKTFLEVRKSEKSGSPKEAAKTFFGKNAEEVRKSGGQKRQIERQARALI
jgi:hypothetical protein